MHGPKGAFVDDAYLDWSEMPERSKIDRDGALDSIRKTMLRMLRAIKRNIRKIGPVAGVAAEAMAEDCVAENFFTKTRLRTTKGEQCDTNNAGGVKVEKAEEEEDSGWNSNGMEEQIEKQRAEDSQAVLDNPLSHEDQKKGMWK